ncbi:class I ribonucleotide reductase maintenance protein YfaE [Colwellia sp. TT2012]|uniref:class I ribonucleotide reductase maintenance protein YfaE n=1 Tax=Colwellia sp. TT2012 TaxID=1720342 RepID=UPI0009EC2F7E|nr:class I ribonucleotide reductase maintenance protein YfaE [Colwellia sp. TT2012]
MSMKVKNATQNMKDIIKLQPKITVQGKVVPFENTEQTLLDCLESANIEVHYHCRDGFCGACRVTLVTGEINYPLGDPLAFVGENEILPCCCVPVTDISIAIDE